MLPTVKLCLTGLEAVYPLPFQARHRAVPASVFHSRFQIYLMQFSQIRHQILLFKYVYSYIIYGKSYVDPCEIWTVIQ